MEDKHQQLDKIRDCISDTDLILDLPESEVDALAQLLGDEQFYIEELLKIQDKSGHVVPFIFNRAQQKLYDAYLSARREKRPVRFIILKARQLGFSTWISALFFHRCATNENTHAMIITHKSDVSSKMLDKHKLFYENLPPELQPMRKNSNAKEIIFENPTSVPSIKRRNPGLRSSIEIETAVNKDIRGITMQMLHLSELAFWPYPEETMNSAMQTVSKDSDSVVIIESTACGVGDTFHRLWLAAERHESEFEPLFFAWFDDPDYAMPVGDDFQISEDEQHLKDTYGLSDEQINWRRWCIRANCGGSEEIFHQEYPSNPQEAFLASGRPVFNIQALEKALALAEPPLWNGRISEDAAGRVQLISSWNGYLRLWQQPQDGHAYIFGVDVAEGLEHGDYSVIEVLDSTTRILVAEWHGHIDPDLLAGEVVRLARYYNNAWVIPEINNHGLALVTAMRKDYHYNRIYRRRSAADQVVDVPTGRYGFLTNSRSKPQLIDNTAAYIRNYWQLIKNRELIEEMMSYYFDEKGRTNAQKGCFDDRVMATALALWGLRERPPDDAGERPPAEDLRNLYGDISPVTGY